MKRQFIVLMHGSRSFDGQQECEQIIQMVSDRLDNAQVHRAYLEFESPSLSEIVDTLFREGIKKVSIFPLFLFNGKHVKVHIPALVEEIRQQYGQMEIELLPHIGVDDKLAQLIVGRLLSLE